MGRAIIRDIKAVRRHERIRELEEIRYGMPTELYLKILHEAAITGEIPTFDRTMTTRTEAIFGPKGSTQSLEPNERVDILKYLVDKALPSNKAVEAPLAPSDINTALATEAEFSTLTREQLESIIHDATKKADEAKAGIEPTAVTTAPTFATPTVE